MHGRRMSEISEPWYFFSFLRKAGDIEWMLFMSGVIDDFMVVV